MPKPGDKAPSFSLVDQNGKKVALSDYAKRRVLVYFYPKADTPGCTQQTCLLRDLSGDIGRTAIIGISPDVPKKQSKFAEKYAVKFPLLADEDHAVSKAYKVWKKKSMYGREYMGIERSAFLIDKGGLVLHAWYKISPKDTAAKLLEALDDLR